eukprot:SAG31_NODE_405_length_16084_cov_3.913982_7_plen_140_part_00
MQTDKSISLSGSNAQEWAPYFGNTANGPLVDCESVGTVYLAPASLYRAPSGTVPQYFPTPFTEHYPVLHAAKHKLGMRIVTDTQIVVQHADTAMFGPQLERIEDDTEKWREWLLNSGYIGKKFDDPVIIDTPVPSFWKG